MKASRSIRSEQLTLILIITLPFFVLLLFTTYQEVQEETRRAQDSAFSLAQLTAAYTAQVIRDSEELLAEIAQRPLIRAMDSTNCDPFIRDFYEVVPTFIGLGVVEASGQIICSATVPAGDPLPSVADREWFQMVKQTGAFIVGPVQTGRLTGLWVSVLAYPVKDESGRFVGALVLPIDLVRYQAGLTGVTLPPEAIITIIDSEGTVVARTLEPELWVGRNTRGSEVVDAALAQGQGYERAQGTDGVERIYGFTAIPEANWYVYAGIPTSFAFARVQTALLRNSLLLMAFALFVAGLNTYLRRRIERPINALARVARAVAQGQTGERTPVTGPQEVVEVATQFNNMLDVNARRTEQLQELAEAALSLNATLAPSEVLQLATEKACQIIGTQLGLGRLAETAEGDQAITVTWSSGEYAAWQAHTERLAAGDLARVVEEANRPVRLSLGELEAHPARVQLGQVGGPLPPLRGWLAAPLNAGSGRTIGFIALSARGEDEFTAEDEAILLQMAQISSVAVENALLFLSLNEQREQLRGLALRLAETEESERRRLARELHDGVGQMLTALNIDLQLLSRRFPAGSAEAAHLEEAQNLVQETIERTRNVLAELRPTVLEESGLGMALRWYGEQFTQRTGIPVLVQGDEVDRRLPTDKELALFRVAQEALTNVVKHAQATRVAITLTKDPPHLRLTIADDGVGFDMVTFSRSRQRPDAAPSWGIINMRERAEAVGGRLYVESQLGNGTKIIIQTPLN
ncbi:MAG: histidine kinase [Chloroflexi bacterium]|nr:histidine kinase [Chloroflexota bacterium]